MFKKLSIFYFVLLLGVGVSIPFLGTSTSAFEGSGSNVCGGELKITKPSDGAVISGIRRFEAKFLPHTATTISPGDISVKFHLNGEPVGSAFFESDYMYVLNWNTETVPNGSYGLSASMHVNSSNTYCGMSTVRTISIDNQVSNTTVSASTLIVTAEPGQWYGATNTATKFDARVELKDSSGNVTNVTSDSVFEWRTTVGSVKKSTSSSGRADFFSGPSTGSGYVTVRAYYGSLTKAKSIPITIYAQDSDASKSYPEVEDSADDSSTSRDSTQTAEQESESSKTIVSGDSELAECMKDILGEERFKQLVQNAQRLSFAELELVKVCFESIRGIVPANIAPAEPQELRTSNTIKRSQRAKINTVVNTYNELDGTLKGLLIEGEAAPSQTVLIYIFSEPLVLSVQADDEGRWSYELTDPLAPGEHEVFVAVEEDEELARSESSFFPIAQASGSEDNPDGLSLRIATEAQSQQAAFDRTFMYAVFAIVLVGAMSGTWLLTHRHHTQAKAEVVVGGDDQQQL